MPKIPDNVAKQVLPVEVLCSRLGYADKKRGHRQYDLTASTKSFRDVYVSPDGIKRVDIYD